MVDLWQPVLGVSWLGHRTLMAVIVVVCTIVVAARTRAWRSAPDVRRPVVLVAAVALAVSVLQLVWGPSAVAPISDMQFHEGWIRQLVGGLPEPSGVYAHVPNSYPWLYHALAAWLELLPGGMVEVYWALQVFAVGSLALGTWLLARELGLREGPATWAVGFASLAGGVGWIWVHEPVAVVSSSRYGLVHGDFLVGPAVTPALANMPAILPRDLALALFPLTVWFALRAVAGRRMRDVAAAGGLAGCLLLIGPVAAVVAVLVCGPVALRRRIPLRQAAAAVAVAAVVVAPWLGRVALNYLRLGGFSPAQPLPSVTASQALVAMGVVLPIGLIGVVWMLRTRPRHRPGRAGAAGGGARRCACSRACCPATAWPVGARRQAAAVPAVLRAGAGHAGRVGGDAVLRGCREGRDRAGGGTGRGRRRLDVLTSIGWPARSAKPRGCTAGADADGRATWCGGGLRPQPPAPRQFGVPQHRRLAIPLGAACAASLPRRVLDHQGAGRARRRDARDRARTRAGGHRLGDAAGGGARAFAGQGHQLPGRRPPPLGRRPGLPAAIIRLDRYPPPRYDGVWENPAVMAADVVIQRYRPWESSGCVY